MKTLVQLLLLIVMVMPVVARGQAVPLASIPVEIASSHFTVTINGQSTPVMHAALNLYFLNFAAQPHAFITVTADSDDFWATGVEVQPWRLNIRPTRHGRSITFPLDGAAKLSISRPGDFGSQAEMLYLFANPAEVGAPTASTPGVRYFAPGLHRENIDAQDGDHIYLADGAVILGSLNVWQVQHVSVSGRGVIVYDGPQNPADDDGWMHKRNWHCIVMDNAHDISIEGITCVVRSRTWQIQMKDSRGVVFDNIKVIGANEGNANADGMDWLGGGDTVVRNSFFRAADDIFALQTSWNGYGPVAFAAQGKPVTNITVENSVLSTSISNIVRAGWPEKNFEGGNFTMRDSDVIHMGLGGCGIPFALMELWADPNGRGQSAGFHFDNIRLEDWYTLTQLMQPTAGVRDVSFTDISALETPSLLPSVLKGAVQAVSLSGTVIAGAAVELAPGVPIESANGAAEPTFIEGGFGVRVITSKGLIRPGQKVSFEAVSSTRQRDLQYIWRFGDGQQATGRKVKHRFADAQGTLLDGSGRFRVLLEISNPAGRHSWIGTPVIVSQELKPARQPASSKAGLAYTLDAHGSNQTLPSEGMAETLALSAVPHPGTQYAITFEGDLQVPQDGGYMFLLVAGEAAMLEVDGEKLTQSRAAIPQVCGLAGMAAQALTGYAALGQGKHHIRVTEAHGEGVDPFRLEWRGPGFGLQQIPAAAWTH